MKPTILILIILITFLILTFDLRAFGETDLNLSLQTSGTYNDHMEFGLSIDPSSSALAGRENPQLVGFVNQNSAEIQLQQSLSQSLTISAKYNPRSELYSGENGKLDEQFSALIYSGQVSLKYTPKPALPPIEVSSSILSLDRRDPIYDALETKFEIRFGQILKYLYQKRDFQDKKLKEDYLLIGSVNQAISGKLQIDFTDSFISKLEYAHEWENYEDNVGKLLLLILHKRLGRNDRRAMPSFKLIQILSSSLLLQEEVNLFFNDSNLDFYDFASYSNGISLFWKQSDENWLRLNLSQSFVKFSNRERGPDVSHQLQLRQDHQFNMGMDTNWNLHKYISLSVNYLLSINRTNSTTPKIPEILNYTNNVVSVALKGEY